MSSRPNFRGGRRGGGPNSRGGGGRGRGGGRGGRGGEQRWWDPVWRAERLRQQAAEMEVLDATEYWGKMEQFRSGAEQEMIIRRNFSRHDQQTLYEMAYELGLHFHAYNKGKALVVSKVPLPDYRADLDDVHGSTQKEIQMSTETAERVGSLLQSSQGQGSKPASGNVVSAASGSGQGNKQPAGASENINRSSFSLVEPDAVKEKQKLSLQLKESQEKMK